MTVENIYNSLGISVWKIKKATIEVKNEKGNEIAYSVSYDEKQNKIILLIKE